MTDTDYDWDYLFSRLGFQICDDKVVFAYLLKSEYVDQGCTVISVRRVDNRVEVGVADHGDVITLEYFPSYQQAYTYCNELLFFTEVISYEEAELQTRLNNLLRRTEVSP